MNLTETRVCGDERASTCGAHPSADASSARDNASLYDASCIVVRVGGCGGTRRARERPRAHRAIARRRLATHAFDFAHLSPTDAHARTHAQSSASAHRRASRVAGGGCRPRAGHGENSGSRRDAPPHPSTLVQPENEPIITKPLAVARQPTPLRQAPASARRARACAQRGTSQRNDSGSRRSRRRRPCRRRAPKRRRDGGRVEAQVSVVDLVEAGARAAAGVAEAGRCARRRRRPEADSSHRKQFTSPPTAAAPRARRTGLVAWSRAARRRAAQ